MTRRAIEVGLLVSFVWVVIGIVGCDLLIDANRTLEPFESEDGRGILYLGMNDTVQCSGNADNDGSWTVAIQIAGKSFTVEVHAKGSSWQSTGIQIGSADEVSFTATGQVRYLVGPDASEEFCGPDGIGGDTSDPCYLAPGLPRHSLVGRIGPGTPFPIGAKATYPDGAAADGRVEVPNFVAENLSWEFIPLSEGSEWFLRDATADWHPTYHPPSTILQKVGEETTVINGVECYVISTQVGDEPIQYSYVHRAEDGIYEYGRKTGTSEPTHFTSPIPLYLLPFEKGKSWTYEVGGEITSITVLFQEGVIISPTAATPAQVHRYCWKLEIKRNGVIENEWYARGVGRVKYVRESRNFELISYEIE